MSFSDTMRLYDALVSYPTSVDNLRRLIGLFKDFGLLGTIKVDCFVQDDLYYVMRNIKTAISTTPKHEASPHLGAQRVMKSLWPAFLDISMSDPRLARLHVQNKLYNLYVEIYNIHLLLIQKIHQKHLYGDCQPVNAQPFTSEVSPLELLSHVASHSERKEVPRESVPLRSDPLRKTCGGIVGPGSCPPSNPCGSTRCEDIHFLNAINHANQLNALYYSNQKNKRGRDASLSSSSSSSSSDDANKSAKQ